MSSRSDTSLDIMTRTAAVLSICDADTKAAASIALYRDWQALEENARERALLTGPGAAMQAGPNEPGRPEQPALVDPRNLKKRGLGSLQGRIALLHSLAHIEFNAINLALDAVCRFRGMPVQYVSDWLRVASDEGQHFALLAARLRDLDCVYGELPAHDGLWEMARRTDHDVLVRMALVPRILEARGLDVAPPMIDRLTQLGDTQSAAILQRIYTDEITHVEVGNRWFRHVCTERGLDGTVVFRDLLKGPASAYLRSPFNDAARFAAGFTPEEMTVIRQMEAEYRQARMD